MRSCRSRAISIARLERRALARPVRRASRAAQAAFSNCPASNGERARRLRHGRPRDDRPLRRPHRRLGRAQGARPRAAPAKWSSWRSRAGRRSSTSLPTADESAQDVVGAPSIRWSTRRESTRWPSGRSIRRMSTQMLHGVPVAAARASRSAHFLQRFFARAPPEISARGSNMRLLLALARRSQDSARRLSRRAHGADDPTRNGSIISAKCCRRTQNVVRADRPAGGGLSLDRPSRDAPRPEISQRPHLQLRPGRDGGVHGPQPPSCCRI